MAIICRGRDIFKSYEYRRTNNAITLKEETMLIGNENILFSFSLPPSPRRRGSNTTICYKATILWIPAFAGMAILNTE
jgi:hypothetical protein